VRRGSMRTWMQRSSFLAGSVPPGACCSAATASGSAVQYVASSGASSDAPNATALHRAPFVLTYAGSLRSYAWERMSKDYMACLSKTG